jgi:hypothetical protein
MRLGDRRLALRTGLFTAIGVYVGRLRLHNSLRFEPIPSKTSILPEHSFRNSPEESALLQKSPDEIDIGSENALEKGQFAKKCRSKAATAAEIASRLTRNSRWCRSSWALCQIAARQIATLPLVRGKRFGVYSYTRQAGAWA